MYVILGATDPQRWGALVIANALEVSVGAVTEGAIV
jgi:hypothetical protein